MELSDRRGNVFEQLYRCFYEEEILGVFAHLSLPAIDRSQTGHNVDTRGKPARNQLFRNLNSLLLSANRSHDERDFFEVGHVETLAEIPG